MIFKRNLLIAFLFAFFFTTNAFAQGNESINTASQKCSEHLKAPFVSDGQDYRVFLSTGETAEFRMVFYGGSTYRLAACIPSGEQPEITIYDQEMNELYSNRDRANTPFWDFKFSSTMVCIVEATLPLELQSGFVVLSIGFKQ